MIELTEHDKRVLSSVGHGAYGKEFVQIISKMRDQLCSLAGLERGGDYSTQVEGRLLFKDFADELSRHMTFEKKPSLHKRQPDGTNYE